MQKILVRAGYVLDLITRIQLQLTIVRDDRTDNGLISRGSFKKGLEAK